MAFAKDMDNINSRNKINIPLLVISIVTILITMLIMLLSTFDITLVFKTNGNPDETISEFFDGIINKNYSSAEKLLSNANNLKFEDETVSDTAKVFNDIVRDNYSYQSLTEATYDHLNASEKISVNYIDTNKLFDAMPGFYEEALNWIVSNTENTELYNEEGYYLENVLETAYYNAAILLKDDVLFNQDNYISTKEIAVNLKYSSGKWMIVLNDDLISCLSGGQAGSLSSKNKTINFTNNISKLSNDNIELVLNDYRQEKHQLKKKYAVGEVEPMPKVENYGTVSSSDVSEVLHIIDKARECGLLDKNEETLFSANAPFLNYSYVHYYFDESILCIIWQEMVDDFYMTFAEVKISDVSQFRRKISEDTFGSSKSYFLSEYASQVNSVVCMNADYYAFRSIGIMAYNGTLYRNTSHLDTLFIDGNGDFQYYDRGTEMSNEELQQYITDNGISFSLSFGPAIIKHGVRQDISPYYPIGQHTETYTRAAICQNSTLHYTYANLGFHNHLEKGATADQFADILYSKGIKDAYILDGGQTSELYFQNDIRNFVAYDDERSVSDMIYFVTGIQ